MSREAETAGLNVLQLGHLRHFDNLSRQPTNDWSLMNGAAERVKSSLGGRLVRCAPSTGLLMRFLFTCCAVSWLILCTNP